MAKLKLNRSLLWLALIWQQQLFACAVCGTATEASKNAFMLSTAVLSLIPMFVIGGFILYLYWAYSRQEP